MASLGKNETTPEAITNLVKRARQVESNTRAREKINKEAKDIGIDINLLNILEQLQQSVEDGIKAKQSSLRAANAPVETNTLDVQPLVLKENQSLSAILAIALEDVNPKDKQNYFKSRTNFVEMIRNQSKPQQEALDKIASDKQLNNAELSNLNSLSNNPEVKEKSNDMVISVKVVVEDILTDPNSQEKKTYSEASDEQKTRVDITQADPVFLKAAKLQGMEIMQALLKEMKAKHDESSNGAKVPSNQKAPAPVLDLSTSNKKNFVNLIKENAVTSASRSSFPRTPLYSK